jgi:hypothetical protein
VSADAKTPLDKSQKAQTGSELPNGTPHLITLERDAEEHHAVLSPAHLWMHRVSMLLFVFFCATLGVILVVFPWGDAWANNSLLAGHPAIQDFVASGFVRGVCSGLGLLDIWIGFWEAVHYHE